MTRMSDNTEQYKQLMTDVIQKQVVILGPQIALLKAKNVQGIAIDDQGRVTSIMGEPQEILQKLVNEYVALSGEIVKKAMEPLLNKYPSIKV